MNSVVLDRSSEQARPGLYDARHDPGNITAMSVKANARNRPINRRTQKAARRVSTVTSRLAKMARRIVAMT
jgi:hypothetical protein